MIPGGEGGMRITVAAVRGPLLAAILGTVAAHAQAQTAPVRIPREPALPETVSVTGTGRVTLAPDRATFTAGVQTVSVSLSAATQENGTRMSAVLAALRRAGAADRELRTAAVSIYPQQGPQEGRPPRIVGYQVSNSVSVTRADPAGVGRLLEAAVDAGANTVSGVSFAVSDPARGRDGALQAAFADARAKAEVLARAAGRALGRAIAITEGTAGSPLPIPMMRAQAMGGGMPVESGTEEVSFTVSVVFELR